MRNHFIIGYSGNKRNEIEKIYQNLNFDNIDTIIEPFCGTSSLSFYISLQQPKKFKYILNDNDDKLIELYNICKNDNKFKTFVDNVNEIALNIKNKEDYLNVIKTNTLEGWMIKHKYYYIRPGLYPLDGISKKK